MKRWTQVTTAIFAGLYLTSMNATADATLYRWKDSNGNMVMSDRQPSSDIDYETISTDSSVVRRVEGEALPQQVKPMTKPEPAIPESSKQQRTVYEKNPEYCEQARNNLEVLGRSARIRMPDGEGDMRYITDEEREAERIKNVESVERHCE